MPAIRATRKCRKKLEGSCAIRLGVSLHDASNGPGPDWSGKGYSGAVVCKCPATIAIRPYFGFPEA